MEIFTGVYMFFLMQFFFIKMKTIFLFFLKIHLQKVELLNIESLMKMLEKVFLSFIHILATKMEKKQIQP
ncbi:Uncharacterised protein [Candidatus Venteria ishoeyi]|uniref:Uncharacterized protein n=1 Tax=Candidatus Venteria ishoeyi TaxID=1899563 RepID=A0A1H6F563_9GAMM|nr:Uncharacterised protein [Candidatus Venteria ishoeyi]